MLLLSNNKIIYALFLVMLFSAYSQSGMAEINFDNVVKEAAKSKGNAPPSATASSKTVEEAWEVHLEIQDDELENSKTREERRQEYNAAREDRRKDHEASHPACKGSKNSCFDLISTESPYRYKVECTHGSKAGEKREVCGNSKGEWTSGCYHLNFSFPTRYKTPEKAAIFACGL